MNLAEVKSNIIGQYPEFSNSTYVENRNGWSNYVLIVDETYVFRIPRSNESSRMLEIEKNVLLAINDYIHIDIPKFEYIAKANSKYNFVGYKMIKGSELSEDRLNKLSEIEYREVIESIASFLSQLHSIDTRTDQITSLSLSNRNEEWENFKDKIIENVSDIFSIEECLWIKSFFEDFQDGISRDDRGVSLTHGDFTEDHILINNINKISGVIDFGDLALGDVAFDFAGIYLSYGKRFMEDVIKCYKLNLDSDFIKRIEEFYIKQIYFHELLHGIETEDNKKVENSILNIRGMINE